MITLDQFEMALWSLKLLDMQELVDNGAIEDRDYAAWDEFQADRVNWLLLHPAKAPAVWQAIWCSTPQAGDLGNVVDLKERRRKG